MGTNFETFNDKGNAHETFLNGQGFPRQRKHCPTVMLAHSMTRKALVCTFIVLSALLNCTHAGAACKKIGNYMLAVTIPPGHQVSFSDVNQWLLKDQNAYDTFRSNMATNGGLA